MHLGSVLCLFSQGQQLCMYFCLGKAPQPPHPAMITWSLTCCWAYQMSRWWPSSENPNNRPGCFLRGAPLLLLVASLLPCDTCQAWTGCTTHLLSQSMGQGQAGNLSPCRAPHAVILAQRHPPSPSTVAFPWCLVWSSNPHGAQRQGPGGTAIDVFWGVWTPRWLHEGTEAEARVCKCLKVMYCSQIWRDF